MRCSGYLPRIILHAFSLRAKNAELLAVGRNKKGGLRRGRLFLALILNLLELKLQVQLQDATIYDCAGEVAVGAVGDSNGLELLTKCSARADGCVGVIKVRVVEHVECRCTKRKRHPFLDFKILVNPEVGAEKEWTAEKVAWITAKVALVFCAEGGCVSRGVRELAQDRA